MKKDVIGRYARAEDGRVIIDITTNKVADLYDDFDKSAPFKKKDLDQEFVGYLIDSVHEIGKEDFVIRINPLSPAESPLISRVQRSIRNYFIYQKELEMRELKKITRTSLILFSIGVTVLTLSVWVNQQPYVEETMLGQIFAEGLTVASWVSLWESGTKFFINWSPHNREIKVYERITKAPVFFA